RSRDAAQIRRALRRLSHLSAGAAQAGAAGAGDATVGAQTWRLGAEGAPNDRATCRQRPHADRPPPRDCKRALPHRGLSGVRGAVRVVILERLADLIRPALAWRAGAAGVKPPGAIEGFGFTVSVGMTSLAGCSGEDFASVLRSLGYRMEKRPNPAASPPAAVESTPPAQPPAGADA